jgi:glycosyltransferase involved in cell wall biosynthesis
MRIVLLQDEIYLPTFAGGTKANRCLLEGLARLGHECMALTPALTRSPDGPRSLSEFAETVASRGIATTEMEPHIFSYECRGVDVVAFNRSSMDQWRQDLARYIERFQPDWTLVADDKRRIMLDATMATAAGRTVLLLQTIVQLPFGPLAVDKNERYADLMARARAIIVISGFMQQYIRTHSALRPHVVNLPVYGEGPFHVLAHHDNRFVTMINPCELKGVSIFLALASQLRDVEFAAVPTWGADDELLRQLRQQPNITILEAADDIEQILAQTRILLTPSLWPESFGYVVPEAMLRGIPVIASDVGGLPEAKLGVDYVLSVTPAVRMGDGYVSPPQDVAPWTRALAELVDDPRVYDRCSRDSREAALDFVADVDAGGIERFLRRLESE